MGTTKLTPVIKIDEEKCINCYACIAACPVKYCVDGSGEKLHVNPDLCIGCGHCIIVCTHKARQPMDDFSRFLADLKQGDKMVAVVAPAIASVFPRKFLNINGFLKSLGVEAMFDVSFGAELTVVSYLDHIRKNNPRMVIAQPCPAIVNYIQIYRPQLIPHLAPADSPMLHTIKMIREYYPQYKNHKVAVISPCIAKRREFDQTGLGDYNVTMLSLKKHLEEQNINVSSFPAVEYVGVQAERAVGFSTPGGLLDTAERFVPGIGRSTRKIEGVHTIYPYLEEIAELIDTDVKMSLLVDCLNCEKGCNGGPGTGNCAEPVNKLENPVHERSVGLEKHVNSRNKKGNGAYKKFHKDINKYWKPGLYDRGYHDLSGNNRLKHPSEVQLNEVYHQLKKFKPEDIYNCTACGYGSCKGMAVAIFNGLNRPGNCLHYNQYILNEEKTVMEDISRQLQQHVKHAVNLIGGISDVVRELDSNMEGHVNAVKESSDIAEKVVGSLRATSDFSRQKQGNIQGFVENAAKGQESMKETIQSVEDISQSIDGIASAIKIIGAIAASTNLLAMNAAIEAAHAGDAGRGFAVVADEIRRLSESTRENSRNISKTLSSIIGGITITTKRSGDTNGLINAMSDEIGDFAQAITEMIRALSEMTDESTKITSALGRVNEHNEEVKKDYAEMLAKSDEIVREMNQLVEQTSQKMTAL
jgi:iron only hydrogenase large subunit-like protein/ABC-type transporter Mla subunit MlaD